MRPFGAQFAVVVALAVVDKREGDRQPAARRPVEKRNGSHFVAIAGIDARDADFPRIGGASGGLIGKRMTRSKLRTDDLLHVLRGEMP